MILCRITQAPFCALLSGSRDRISEPRNFDPVTIGCGFADHALQCSKPGTDASYLVLTALGGLAEFERDLSRGRTSDGREWAKARSFKLGRKPKTDRTPAATVVSEALRGIARSYNTISRLTA
jgi:DNA invertase Pin-like site-specific DNA recombinase